ncbi:SMP-30/gluconolactonase/LRE family protein [Mycolicibacterium hodleri]
MCIAEVSVWGRVGIGLAASIATQWRFGDDPMRIAEQLTRSFAHHGEGPFWDSRGNRLLCMDVFASAVVAIDSDGDIRRYPVPGRAATVIRHRARSGFVIGTEHGLVFSNEELSDFEHLATVVSDDATVRTNDGGCDPLGGFVIGTMSYIGQPEHGAVYRVAPDLRVTELLASVSISNGVQWSADGTRAFYIDSPTRRVDAFDVDPHTGAWSGRQTLIRFDGLGGVPDGMAIDEDDGLWIAVWGDGVVNHYDKAGRFVEAIAVPGVTQVSSCAFGGDGRSVLFITTSRQDLRDGEQPNAGAVFSIRTGVRGAAQAEFHPE